MKESLEASLVRIYSTDGYVVGAGFLVGERHLLTCAHVVAGALSLADNTPEKPQAPVHLDIPRVAPGQLLTARVVLWRPPHADGGDDIAGLELVSDPPDWAQPAPLAQVEDLWEHSFRAFGFPRGQDNGVWATGRLLGRQLTNWVQIEDTKETGFAVEPGFSGTPIWDPQVDAVVGMVVAAEKRTNLKTAFAIPVDVLARSWPLLESLIHPFVFICYARADYELVARLKDDLLHQGIYVWIDREGLHPGTPDWEEALRTAIRSARAVLFIASPHALSSRYVKDELAIAQMYQRPVYPLWIAGTHWMDAAPLGWGQTQYIDARESRYETAISELVALLNMASSTEVKIPELDFEPRNPYKGLRAFNGDDAQDFFGRDMLTHELLAALERKLVSEEKDQQFARLLAVVGPSGSGKSSAVMAGLLPGLRQGELPGSEQWVYLDPMVPGSRPIEALTLTLSEHLPDKSMKAIREDLEDDSARGLHLIATKLAKRSATKVVLLVDQFEELFAQTHSEDERRHFLDLLVTAATEPKGPLIVLLTLRADFYDRPLAYPALGQLIPRHQIVVLPMNIHELREVIEKPAALPDVRLTFEGDLVGDLLFEVQGQVGDLPLLQFTLDQLYQRRVGSLLTLSSYRELGGVRGALARQAEETYDALPSDEHRRLARALFVRLIDPGASEHDTTRRRAVLKEFSLPQANQTRILQEAAEAFIAARLLTTNKIAGTTTIEVSHEALIREWPRLDGWLREARDDIRLQQNISKDVAEWEQRNKPVDRLYRGSQLKEAQAWARRNTPSGNEVAFLRAGSARRMRSLASVTIIVFLLLSTTGGVGWLLLQRPIDPTHVNSLKDAGPGSLQYAVDAANQGSTITFDSSLHGTIQLANENLIIAKNLTIRGPGKGILTISNGQNGHFVHVVQGVTVTIIGLTFKDSQTTNGFIDNDGTLTLRNLTVSDNASRSDSVGVIYNTGTLTIVNSSITGNTAEGIRSTGGIDNNGGTLTIVNSIISDNTSQFAAGGINNTGSFTLSLTDSTVSGNTGHYSDGGGIAFSGSGTLSLTDSTVSGNTADGNGGGIAFSGSGTLSLTNSTVSGNTADGNGGGIAFSTTGNASGGTLSLTNSTVSGNTADGNGGGIAFSTTSNANGGAFSIGNSTVSGNTAGGNGGGIAFDTTGTFSNPLEIFFPFTLIDSTFANNLARGNGGAISISKFFFGAIISCTVYGNTAGVGGGFWSEKSSFLGQFYAYVQASIIAGNKAHTDPDIAALLATNGYNFFGDLTRATPVNISNGPSTDLSGEKFSNLKIDPVLRANGGPTKTLALSPDSPAVDKIPLVACQSTSRFFPAITPIRVNTTDQRGLKRPDGNELLCDIGAYEYQDTPT